MAFILINPVESPAQSARCRGVAIQCAEGLDRQNRSDLPGDVGTWPKAAIGVGVVRLEGGFVPDWLFSEPPNLAVIASKTIFEGAYIGFVSHDADDGGWQFIAAAGETNEVDAMLVSLQSVVDHDPTIKLLADLPLGWVAERHSADEPWYRYRQSIYGE
jgi:hypothetical protein